MTGKTSLWYHRTMKVLSLPKIAQYAWAAGFFDGEGHVGFSLQERKSGIPYPAQRISITQWYTTTSLETFRDIFGVGTVEQHSANKPWAWRFREQSPDRISFIMETMFPYLSEIKQSDWLKTQRAHKEYLEAKSEYLKLCKVGHDQTEHGFKNSAGRHQCRLCTREYNRAYRKRMKDAKLRGTPSSHGLFTP